jgi:hypothetical protein
MGDCRPRTLGLLFAAEDQGTEINFPHQLYSTRESMFRNVCILKDLCSRCGRKGHKAVECSEPKKAAWAGGDAL